MRKLLFIFLFALSSGVLAREVQFNWNPMVNATGYEVEVSETQGFEKVLVTQKLTEPAFSTNIGMGQYFYRVRAIDLKGRPGKWSQPAPIAINPYSPEPVEPQKGYEITYIEILPKIKFSWKPPAEADDKTTYEVLISKGNGQKVLEKQTDKTDLEIDDIAEGDYNWQVRATAKKSFVSSYCDSRAFTVKRIPLKPAELIIPADKGYAPAYRPVYYLWKPDPNAKYSDLYIEKIAEIDGSPAKGKQKIENISVPDYESEFQEPGKYRWSVTNKEAPNTPGVASEPFEFEIRNDIIAKGNFELEFSASQFTDLYTTSSARQTAGATSIGQDTKSQGTYLGFLGGYYFTESFGFFLSTRTAKVAVENQNPLIQETDANIRLRMGSRGFNQEFIFGYRFMNIIAPENNPTVLVNDFTTSGPLVGTRITATIVPKFRTQLYGFYYKPVSNLAGLSGLTADVYGGYIGFKWNFMYQLWLGYRYGVERVVGSFQTPGQPAGVNSTWNQYRTEPLFFSISFEH